MKARRSLPPLILLAGSVGGPGGGRPSPAAAFFARPRPRRPQPPRFRPFPRPPPAAAAASSSSTTTAKATTEEDYGALTVPLLKDICRERGLPVSGTKAAILRRILDDDEDSGGGGGPAGPDEGAETTTSPPPPPAVDVSGEPEEAEARDYARLTVAKLKVVCRERGLPVSGTKAVLVERLKGHDEEHAPAAVEAPAERESQDDDSDDGALFEEDDDADYGIGALTEQLARIEDALLLGDDDVGAGGREEEGAEDDFYDARDWDRGPSVSSSSRAESRKLWYLARDVERLVQGNDPLAVPVAERLIESMNAAYDRTGEDRFRPTERSYTLLCNAHAKSGLPDAARNAEAVLRSMQNDDDVPVRPNAYIYTAVIDAYARSRDRDAAERAEELLYEMMDRASWDPACAPTFKTGDAVLNAWARRGTAEGARRAELLLERIGQLEQVQKGTKEELAAAVAAEEEGGMRLTTSSFATVITGWARSGAPGGKAAEKAEEVLERLVALYEETEDERRKRELRPNTVIFNAVIDAWGKSRDPRAGMKAEALLVRMQQMASDDADLDCEPDEFSYNSCINSHANSGHRNAARLAEGVLKRMQDGGKIPPNTISYNSVLNAWSKSKLPGAAERAEQILLYMIDAYNSGSKDIKPTVYSFSSVLNSRAKSKEPGKARRTQAILRMLTEVHEKTGGADQDLRPNNYCYNGVLNACAFSADFEEDEKRDALEVAVQTLNEMRGAGHCRPDSVTYGNVLKCLANLMPVGEARNRMGAQIFESCCKDGQVGEMVLNEVLRAIPKKMFDSLVGGRVRRNGPHLSSRDLPRQWTRNVNESGTYKGKVKPPRRKKPERAGRPRRRKQPSEVGDEEVPVRPAARIVEGSWDSSRDV